MTMLKAGLIQMGLKGSTDMSPQQIRDKMIEAGYEPKKKR